jgi:hypothetical protein
VKENDMSGGMVFDGDDFDNYTPPVMPAGFNDDQPRGVTLSELLRDHIKETETVPNPNNIDIAQYSVPLRNEG